MSTTTLERSEVVTLAPSIALTPSEEDSLIALAASTEKPARVRGTGGLRGSVRESRAWSFGGNVD